MTSKDPTPLSQAREETARREFLKQVGKVAVTAPAIALLLAASSKPASATPISGYAPDQCPDESFAGGDCQNPV